MSDIPDILRLRVLLAFLKEDRETCTVTGISRTLGEEKYKISRIVIGLEKDGLIDRSDQRHPVLTKVGKKTAEQCAERIRISLSHLLYEGVDLAPETMRLSGHCIARTRRWRRFVQRRRAIA